MPVLLVCAAAACGDAAPSTGGGESGTEEATQPDSGADGGGGGVRFDAGEGPGCVDPPDGPASICDPQPGDVGFELVFDDVTAELDGDHGPETCTVGAFSAGTDGVDVTLDCANAVDGAHVHWFMLAAAGLTLSGIAEGDSVSLELEHRVFMSDYWAPAPVWTCPHDCVTTIVRDEAGDLVVAVLLGYQEDRLQRLDPVRAALDRTRCEREPAPVPDQCGPHDCLVWRRLGLDVAVAEEALSLLDGARGSIGVAPSYDMILGEARDNEVVCSDSVAPETTLELLVARE